MIRRILFAAFRCATALLVAVFCRDGAWLAGARGAEFEAAVIPASANYAESIPTQFLEAAAPLDATMLVEAADRSKFAGGHSTSGDQQAAEAAAAAYRPAGRYFPTLPSGFETDPAAFAAAMGAPTQIVPTSHEQPPPQFAMPPSMNFSSAMPPMDPSAFPPYVPGMPVGGLMSPPGYPGAPVQFQESIPEPFLAGPPPGFVPPEFENPARARIFRLRERGQPARWSVGVESLFLTEGGRPAGPPLVQSVATDAVLLQSTQLTGAWGKGPRLTLSRQHSDRVGYEFAYSGIYQWTQYAQVEADNDLRLAGDVAFASLDHFLADVMQVTVRTAIHSFESSFQLTPDAPLGTFIVGSRYLYWTEQFDLYSTDLDQFASEYLVNATNRMYGAQIGWNGSIPWAAGETLIKLRGGIFASHASQGQTLYDFDNTFELRPPTGATDNRTSYLGEFSVVQCFNPGAGIDLRIGYSMMWIEGLARALEQVDLTDNFDSGSFIQSDGSIFMHGASLGATFSW